MKHLRIAERIFNRPLMISEAKLNAILHVFSQRAGLELVGVSAGTVDPVEAAKERQRARDGYTVDDGLAIIGIYGPLMHRVLEMEFPSGGPTTYADIRRAFDAALADPDVKRIALDIDSPGGEVNGAFDLADHIYQSRGVKPITAVVNESAFSAAYLIASAADRIVLPRTAGVGSVGVIATHTEFSRWEEDNGITVTHIYAGARKADYSPHKPLSEEAAAALRELVDDTYMLFVETVARNRNMEPAAVVDTEAAIYVGKKAVKAGLADQVAPVDQAMRIAASAKKPRAKEIAAMKIVEELREQYPDLVAQIEEQARQGMIAQAEAETARTEAVTTETERLLGLVRAAVGDETADRIAAAHAKELTAEDLASLGVALAATGQNARQQALEAITQAASTGVQSVTGKPDADDARKQAAAAIAAAGSIQ